jgi:hypothetical protein
MERRPLQRHMGTKLDVDSSLGSIEQPVFVPLATGARLPRCCAQIAEALAASARNVETALVQLDDGMTAGTRLPFLCTGESPEL